MKKTLMTLFVAGVALWAAPVFAENGGDTTKAIPDSAIETGNGVWSPSPSPSVVYTRSLSDLTVARNFEKSS